MDTTNLFRLDGKVALVTGGSRVIGKMIAAGFIAQGAKVYISSRKAPACDDTAAELGPNCIPLPCDVSTVAGCKALAEQLERIEKTLAWRGATVYSRARRLTSTLLFDLPGVACAEVAAALAEVGVLAPAGHFYAL